MKKVFLVYMSDSDSIAMDPFLIAMLSDCSDIERIKSEAIKRYDFIRNPEFDISVTNLNELI